MKNFLILAVLCCLCGPAFGQNVLTLEELDSLANKNAKAIQVLDENVKLLFDEIKTLKEKDGEGDRLTVGRLAPEREDDQSDYAMPEPLRRSTSTPSVGRLSDIDARLEILESKVRVVPSGLEDYDYDKIFTTSSYIPPVTKVSVGQPFITSVGQPRVTYTSSPLSYTGSGVCNDPFCTNPNCPGKQNTSYSSMFSNNLSYNPVSNVRYTSSRPVTTRPVRGQVICNNGVCYKVK